MDKENFSYNPGTDVKEIPPPKLVGELDSNIGLLQVYLTALKNIVTPKKV